MPIYSHICDDGHETEVFYLTFRAAEGAVRIVPCKTCGKPARKQDFSVPAPGQFFGNPDGYYKPSPRKRFSNKLVSQKEGNKHSS